VNGEVLDWLLEIDPTNPGARYFTLRDLLGRPDEDPTLKGNQS